MCPLTQAGEKVGPRSHAGGENEQGGTEPRYLIRSADAGEDETQEHGTNKRGEYGKEKIEALVGTKLRVGELDHVRLCIFRARVEIRGRAAWK